MRYAVAKDILFRFTVLLPAAIFLFHACRHDEEELPSPVSFTALIYMVADSDMDSHVEYTLNQLKAGAGRSAGNTVILSPLPPACWPKQATTLRASPIPRCCCICLSAKTNCRKPAVIIWNITGTGNSPWQTDG